MLIVRNLVKTYRSKGGVITKALDDVTVSFPETGMVFLLGKSGSGKSTLLNMIGGLDKPDSGEIIVKGKSSKNFSNTDFDSYRNTFIGFVFQEYNILNEFNVEQNIALALQLQGKKAKKEDVAKILKEVDLIGLEKRKPNTLSGGQKQRIAIARALIKEPQLIMADEPTGALDSNTGKQVFDTLRKLSQTKLVIVVSHDNDFAELYGDRIIELKDGKIISDKSKIFIEPSKLSNNVNLVSNNVIQIKDGKKLTANDKKTILNAFKKQSGEIIISCGSPTTTNVKKSLNINENGSCETFAKTSNVKVKDYDASKTKFIKSKMPFSRAIKIGASSLKIKPFRLLMTIFLSTISFTMFGVVSTLMLYDENYSIRESMKKVDYIAETISKNYYYNLQEIKLGYKNGNTSVNDYGRTKSLTKFGSQELIDLNKSHSDFEFAGLFNFSSGDAEFKIENASVTGTIEDYFPYDSFNGFSDCGSEYLNKYFSIEKNNDGIDCGYYPTDIDEVAISNYMAADLLNSPFSKVGMDSYEDLLGEKIKISRPGVRKSLNIELTITGIYHIGDIPTTYDSLKTEKSPDERYEERSSLYEKYKNFINGGFFRTAFVNDKFYDHYKSYVDEDFYVNIPKVSTDYLLFDSNYIGNSQEVPQYGISLSALDLSQYLPGIKFYNFSDNLEVDPKDISLSKYDFIFSKEEYDFFNFTNIGKYGALSKAYASFNCNEDEFFRKYLNDQENLECSDINVNYYPYFNNVILNNQEKDNDFYIAYEKILGFINKYYQRCYERDFISTCALYSFYREVIDHESQYSDVTADPLWNNVKESFNKILGGEKLADEKWIELANFTKKYVESVKPFKNQVYYFIGNDLDNKGYQQYRGLFGENNYEGLLINLSSNQITDEEVKKFETLTKDFYKKIYGESIDFEKVDSYYPNFKYNDKYNLKYFFKGTSSKGEMNPKYYFTYGPYSSGNFIVAREFLIDFVSDDTNVWVTNIVTSYEELKDAKYNYLMVPSTYTDNEIEIMMQKHDTYCYEMTNATYIEISLMIDLINGFKQIFFYIV